MTDSLLSLLALVRVNPQDFQVEWGELAQIRSRKSAFLRAVREFAVLAFESSAERQSFIEAMDGPSANDPDLKEFKMDFQAGKVRYLDCSAETTCAGVVTVSLATWEDSPLGGVWRAEIVEEGDAVCRHLLLAMRSNDHVFVLDPALARLCGRPARARQKLLSLCREFTNIVRLTVVSELPKLTESANGSYQDLERTNEVFAEETKRFLAGRPEVVVEWRVRKHSGRFHDRFIAFRRRSLAPQPPIYHAFAIGIGAQGLVPGGEAERLTTVARVPSESFAAAWDSLQKMKDWTHLQFVPPPVDGEQQVSKSL